MLKIPTDIEKTITEYMNEINREIPITKAYIFGSYASGKFQEDSDIDLAVFSDFFNNMEQVDGTKWLLLKAMEYEIDLEPIAFTNNELEEPVGIVQEIVETGIEWSV